MNLFLININKRKLLSKIINFTFYNLPFIKREIYGFRIEKMLGIGVEANIYKASRDHKKYVLKTFRKPLEAPVEENLNLIAQYNLKNKSIYKFSLIKEKEKVKGIYYEYEKLQPLVIKKLSPEERKKYLLDFLEMQLYLKKNFGLLYFDGALENYMLNKEGALKLIDYGKRIRMISKENKSAFLRNIILFILELFGQSEDILDYDYEEDIIRKHNVRALGSESSSSAEKDILEINLEMWNSILESKRIENEIEILLKETIEKLKAI